MKHIPSSPVRASDPFMVPVNSYISPSEEALSKSFQSTPTRGKISVQHPLVSPDRFAERSVIFTTQRFVAMDCEMVGVGVGGKRSVVARVSLVDFTGRPFFDKFVKVTEDVTDYRTFISGVTAEDLNSSHAISFEECQKQVLSLIANKILVGHALKNDMEVLKISHPWYMIRDTSMYFPYMKVDSFGRLSPRSLRVLAQAYLGIRIQDYGKPHDSKEDASAAMALYRKVQVEWDVAIDCKRRSLVLQSPVPTFFTF